MATSFRAALASCALSGLLSTSCGEATSTTCNEPDVMLDATAEDASDGTDAQCADPDPGYSTDADVDLLVDRQWYLEAWLDEQGRRRHVGPGYNPWIVLNSDGTAGGASACNFLNVDTLSEDDRDWSLEGERFSFGSVNTTLMLCPHEVLDWLYTGATMRVTEATALRVSDESLALFGPDGEELVAFRASADIVGRWKLDWLAPAPDFVRESVLEETSPEALFLPDGTMYASLGCGYHTGTFSYDSDHLSVALEEVNAEGCGAVEGDAEQVARALETLAQVTGYQFGSAVVLNLLDADGHEVASFRFSALRDLSF
ncbi:MAG: META domain-containing protein [Deltaproteobacteria bacterium]|nr:MAG: META domain-containing protein [Deltaproteobacteria bacterium]